MSHHLTKYLTLIILWGMIIGLVAGIASLVFPKEYSAESKVLIISRDRSGVDPYTQAKSAERVGENLAQVMGTKDFLDKVLNNSTADFDRSVWQNLSDRQQRRAWERNVQASVQFNTSIMNVKVYARTPAEATRFSRAVTDTIVSQGLEYVGGSVFLKEVSSPLASRFPARPNILLNVAIGFALGALCAALWRAKYAKHSVFGN